MFLVAHWPKFFHLIILLVIVCKAYGHVNSTMKKIPQKSVNNIYDTFTLIKSFKSDLKTCLLQSNQDPTCYFAIYKPKATNSCLLYKMPAALSIISLVSADLYFKKDMQIKQPNTQGLQSYWPMNNDINDFIVNGSNWALAPDRFNNSNGSVYFQSGYLQVPQDVYFNGGDFTILMWVKTKNVFWQSLLDFGDLNLTNNVIFQLDYSNRPNVQITSGSNSKWYFSTKSLINNAWNHMVATLNGTTLMMYLNGLNISKETVTFRPLNKTRQMCFIGRSNWYWKPNNPDSIAYLSDIKIFNRAFTQQDVIDDMMIGTMQF